MAADRSRITYHPARKYREVIGQQGRVLLEADSNEGARIASEEVRRHALDFVGSCGTPDDGYRITPLPGFDFQVGPGTMYVGGLRTTLEAAITYSAQPDWLDKGQPQPWADLPFLLPPALRDLNTHALLVLREQEVTAIEDPALRETALGGPDSAARTRLLQRIVGFQSAASTCAAAAKEVPARWSALGLVLDHKTAELRSRARLKVTPVVNAPPPSPCDPPSASGYLGADNQLIRVQVVAFNAAGNSGRLIWGYDNASTLYRCRSIDPTTLELDSRPVAVERQPRVGQIVQVALAAANLGEGAFAAALAGHTAKLTAPYATETRRVTLPGAMPALLQQPAGSPPLFLRLWEEELDFNIDAPVTLKGTGLQVTISRADAGPLHLGDHWSFGVRPLTPTAVEPGRYLDAPQPPDGPRMWSCPLAVLRPVGESFQVEDCRSRFDDLVELTAREQGSCCCVTIGPKQAVDLQKIIDQAVQGADGRKVMVHLESGVYPLPRPLVLEARHKGLVIDSCTGDAVTLTAADKGKGFFEGMILALGVEDVAIRGVDFEMAPSPFPDDAMAAIEAAVKSDVPGLDWVPRLASVGVRAVACDSLALDSCRFLFPADSPLYGAGLLMQADNGRIEVTRCEFVGPLKEADSILTGIVLGPLPTGRVGPQSVPSSVELLRVESCLFATITTGVLITGRPYSVQVGGNLARSVHSAFGLYWFGEKVTRPRGFFELLDSVKNEQFKGLSGEIRQDRRTLRELAFSLIWPAGKLIDRLKVDARRTSALLGRRDVAAMALVPGVQPEGLTLTMESNQFEARRAVGDKAPSGIAVAVWHLTPEPGFVTITGNTISNRSTLPTLVVAQPEGFNLTGNVINNQNPRNVPGRVGPRERALLVQPGGVGGDKDPVAMFTVTGNTIFGTTNLADFPRLEWKNRLPDGLGALLTWEFFNSIG